MTATAWPERQHDDGIPTAPWMAGSPFPCRRDPDLFFSDDKDDIVEAKRICTKECSLTRRIACMDYAFDNNLEYGVWGGIGREDRVEKQCVTCEETKLLADFPTHAGTLDGYNPTCWACAVEIGRQDADHLPDREVTVALLERACAQQTAKAEERMRMYALLLEQRGRDEAIRILKITVRTAQRYEARLREQQTEVAA
jgi:hypothetical protein